MTVAVSARALARLVREELGGDCSVQRYWDEGETNSVDVLRSASGEEFVYCTVTLHQHPNELDGISIPTELMFVADDEDPSVALMLASAAFRVIKDGWLAAPGVVFPHAVSEYFPCALVPHLLWVAPFPWPGLGAMELPMAQSVHALLGVAVSDGEWRLLRDRGLDALEGVLEAANANYRGTLRDSTI